jgi:hypothetical protein
LVSSKSPAKKKGKSKRAQVLVAAVERATANFVERHSDPKSIIPFQNTKMKILWPFQYHKTFGPSNLSQVVDPL